MVISCVNAPGKKRSCSDSRIQSSSSITQYVIVPWTTIFVHSMQYIVVVLLACLSIKMQSQGATDFGSHFRFYLISRHANIMLCTSQQYYIVFGCLLYISMQFRRIEGSEIILLIHSLFNSKFYACFFMTLFFSGSFQFISDKPPKKNVFKVNFLCQKIE